MNIIALMAGSSDDFQNKGYIYPKYLLEINGKLLVEALVDSLKALEAKEIFIIRNIDNQKYHLSNTISLLSPKSEIVVAENETKGALCTALFAIEKLKADEDLLIINGDQLIRSDLQAIIKTFREKNADGGIITFDSVHPRWSYVMLNDSNEVVQVAEKRPISRYATAGCYYYRRAEDFIQAALNVLRKDININGLYYISSTYNEMILEYKKILTHHIPAEEYISFANYSLYKNYISTHKEGWDD